MKALLTLIQSLLSDSVALFLFQEYYTKTTDGEIKNETIELVKTPRMR